MIQLGAILAVVWLYRAKVVAVVVRAAARRGGPAVRAGWCWPAAFPRSWPARSFSGLREAGALRQPARDGRRRSSLGGLVMLAVERCGPRPRCIDAGAAAAGRALRLGCCQTLALVPGVSRSGATIVGGLLLGLDRAAAAEFSFFLAIPTISAAFVHDLLRRAGPAHVRPGRRDRRRVRGGVPVGAGRRAAVPPIRRPARASRRSRGIESPLGVAAACGHGGRVACE